MEKQEFNCTLEVVDVEDFLRYRNAGSPRQLIRLAVVIFLMVMLLNYASFDVFLFWVLSYLAVRLFIFPIVLTRKSKKLMNSQKSYLHPIYYHFDSEAIRSKTKFSEITSAWKILHKVVEIKGIFMLYFSRNSAMILPKRGLTSEELANFRQILRQNASCEIKLLDN